MNKVVVRALSGAVYIALILAAIYFGEFTFCALTMLFAAIGLHEFFIMSHAPFGDKGRYYGVEIIDVVFGALLPLTVMPNPLSWLSTICLLSLYFLIRATVSLTDHGEHAYREVAKSVFGVMYIGFGMMMLNALYHLPAGDWMVLFMFIMIWLNDTGAFCFGITLGKHRLCERLSPKKSWEGFWGGMACCVAFGAICYFYFNQLSLSLWQWMILGAVISLFSTWGDLFESMLKRTVQVKDSGHLIPGHGGILDRIDSLLFVAPVTMLLALLFK